MNALRRWILRRWGIRHVRAAWLFSRAERWRRECGGLCLHASDYAFLNAVRRGEAVDPWDNFNPEAGG